VWLSAQEMQGESLDKDMHVSLYVNPSKGTYLLEFFVNCVGHSRLLTSDVELVGELIDYSTGKNIQQALFQYPTSMRESSLIGDKAIQLL